MGFGNISPSPRAPAPSQALVPAPVLAPPQATATAPEQPYSPERDPQIIADVNAAYDVAMKRVEKRVLGMTSNNAARFRKTEKDRIIKALADKMDMTAYMKGMLNESGKYELSKSPESAAIRGYSKKMVATLNRELTKITRNLQGIREMNRLPDAMVVVDPKREYIAVREAHRMGVTTVALIDTDSDPDTIDLPIPGNDDSIRSIELMLNKLADAVIEGRASIPPAPEGSGGPASGRSPRGPGPAPNPKPVPAVVS